MGVLHPFSAASKPMQDWDSLPSRPLQFAATLHPFDPNAQRDSSPGASPSARIPRPRHHDDVDISGPSTPPASMRPRYGSISSPQWGVDRSPTILGSPNTRGHPVGSDEWMQREVSRCVDNAHSTLDLTNSGLERLSTRISDMQHLVTLPQGQSPTASPSRPDNRFSPLQRDPHGRGAHLMPLSERTFSRTQSAPASASFFSRLNGVDAGQSGRAASTLLPSPSIATGQGVPAASQSHLGVSPLSVASAGVAPFGASPLAVGNRRRFQRSKTGAGLDFSKRLTPAISIFLSSNRLTTLPSALFEIQYLTVLTLRSNQLKYLPAAIGELAHLKELNISNNKLEYLPSTIFNLSLDQFSAMNNPWRSPPSFVGENQPPTLSSLAARTLSPIYALSTANVDVSSVPRLTSLCLSVLVSPRAPNGLPPLIECYDWDVLSKGGNHPLLDPERLRDHMPGVTPQDAVRVLQAVRSACAAATTQAPHGRRRSTLPRSDPFPRSYQTAEPDDVSTNPYYYPCPSPRHREGSGDLDTPLRHIFLDAAEERFEWVDFCGEKNIPVRWVGCSPGCLAFLDEVDEDDMCLDELDLSGESD